MTDLFVWGGPVYCSTMDAVQWERPTVVSCHPVEGSTGNASYYASLPKGLDSLVAKAGISDLGSIGLAGFSAFHGFARGVLADATDRERVSYVHLADACFKGAGATVPNDTYLWFAKKAVAGQVRMVATTNGPYGKDIHYSYEGTNYDLTSGAKCVQLFWDAATGGSEGTAADVPPGVPAPTFAKRIGELYWFHYETAPTGKDPHAWHATTLAVPYIQMYGVPWMAGQRGFDLRGGLIAAAFAAFGYVSARLVMRKMRG